jgi:hypothetical protein
MTRTRFLKTAGVISAFAAIVLVAMLNNSKPGRARDDDGGDEREESRVRRGFEIAPVHLNLEGKTARWWDGAAILLTHKGGRQPTQDRALSMTMNSVT